MTAREQLREQVERLTEDEARDALLVLARNRFDALHRDAPQDDEPFEDSAETAASNDQADRGETVPLGQLRAELGEEQRFTYRLARPEGRAYGSEASERLVASAPGQDVGVELEERSVAHSDVV